MFIADLASAIESNSFTRRLTPASRFKLKTALETLVINFYRLQVTDPDRLLAIPLGAMHYTGTYVHHRSMIHALRGLEALGYIRIARNGFWNPVTKKGEVTRYQALPRLIEGLSFWSLAPSMIELRPRRHLVEIRPSKQMRRKLLNADRHCPDTLPWPNEHRKLKLERERDVRKINKALREQFTALQIKDKTLREQLGHLKRPVNFFQSDLHRVFTLDPFKNGRLANGWWMTLPKKLRSYIRMSAPSKHPSRVVEVDYEAIHIQMLYAQGQSTCPDVPYGIGVWGNEIHAELRKIVKACTLTMINATSKSGALKAIRKEYAKKFRKWADANPRHPPLPPKDRVDAMISTMYPEAECPPLRELLDAIEKYHGPIRHRFYTGAGRELMFEDSEMSIRIMLRMIDEYGVAPLPLHDSFIVRHDYEDQLIAVMAEEFGSRFGVLIPLRAERSRRRRPNRDLVIDSKESLQAAWRQERADYKLYDSLLVGWVKAQPEQNRATLWMDAFKESGTAATVGHHRREKRRKQSEMAQGT